MIPLTLATALKNAGLIWRTSNHDFFAVPERGMDDKVFVLADMMAYTELVQGWPVVSFHGTAEWALDYILTTDVVWLPTEEQLRDELIQLLETTGAAYQVALTCRLDDVRCSITIEAETLEFPAATAGEAYGQAVLHLLESQNLPDEV
ncbi:MAG: pilus assembly protein CpaE [Chloroflexota bacterium]|jgi:hypothetical protein